jgi:sugar lactone lactonase YvrE
MKLKHLVIASAFLFASLFCAEKSTEKPADKLTGKVKAVKVWETEPVLQTSESVMYDTVNKVLYVSCINGQPTGKDGNGYIARIGLDGKVLTQKWVTGMDAPKGMGITGSRLYVTDIDRVHEIDIEKAKIISTYNAKGAKFLNDIAIDETGKVYISDMDTNKIYVLSGGKLEVWLNSKYKNVNGMLYRKGLLLAGSEQGIVFINMADKKETLGVKNSGGIDGLKMLAENRFIVSDWAGKTSVIGDMPDVLLNTSAQKINSADFEYIPEKKFLLIPTFFHNTVACYRLEQQ